MSNMVRKNWNFAYNKKVLVIGNSDNRDSFLPGTVGITASMNLFPRNAGIATFGFTKSFSKIIAPWVQVHRVIAGYGEYGGIYLDQKTILAKDIVILGDLFQDPVHGKHLEHLDAERVSLAEIRNVIKSLSSTERKKCVIHMSHSVMENIEVSYLAGTISADYKLEKFYPNHEASMMLFGIPCYSFPYGHDGEGYWEVRLDHNLEEKYELAVL